jgi:amino acid transporter
MEATTLAAKLEGVTRHTRKPLKLLARATATATAVTVALLLAGILLVVADGNPHNAIVSTIDDFAKTLAGPFADMFAPHARKLAVALNWGVAAGVYLVAGNALAARLRRLAGIEGGD